MNVRKLIGLLKPLNKFWRKPNQSNSEADKISAKTIMYEIKDVMEVLKTS